MTRDEFRAIAWADFIQHSLNVPECVALFEKTVGMKIANRSGIEIAIDQATGYEDAAMEEFVAWVTVNFWGEHYAPQSWRDSRVGKTQYELMDAN